MTKEEMREKLKGKSEEEVREIMTNLLQEILEDIKNLSVKDEKYETANEALKIQNRIDIRVDKEKNT
jgi:uncharacterized membrane-anchored protein